MEVNIEKFVEELIKIDPKPGEMQNQFNKVYDMINRYSYSDDVDFGSIELGDIHLTIEEVIFYNPEDYEDNDPDNAIDTFNQTWELRFLLEQLPGGDSDDFI